MLPIDFSNSTYWQEIYPQPLSYWQDSLNRITRHHFHQAVDWQRAALGRNVVFLSETLVLKLCPPGWVEESSREVTALSWVSGRLPVETPELVNSGSLDGWSYIIQRRLPGRNLHELWKSLDSGQRGRLARQHGEILAALHALGLPDHAVQKGLYFDWKAMIAEQRAACAQEMLRAGVNPALVDQVESYLAVSDGLLQEETHQVLLHGDLTHLNFLVHPDGSGWQITSLIDWGDARLGPPGHEFISPGVHMYLGDRGSLSAFYQSCGEALTPVRFPEELMARAMLYYAQDFPRLLAVNPDSRGCQDWACISGSMW